MSDLFEEAVGDNSKENVQMKSGEITGDQHLFHSLPKEFQVWHTTYYILEKEGDLDRNTIPKSQLNAYLWKILLNSTFYAFVTFLIIMHVVVVERMSNSIFITGIDLLLFFGASLYIAYQFYFFGVISAQVIGPITEEAHKNTSKAYINTYISTLFALIIMVLFTLSVNETLLELLFRIIYILHLKYQDSSMPYLTELLFNTLIYIHNFIVVAVYNYNNFFTNVYVMIILLTLFQLGLIYIVFNLAFRSTRKEIIYEVSKDKLNKKFPIEKSQMVITAWRNKHGI